MKIAYLSGSLNRGGKEVLLLDIFKNNGFAKYKFIGITRKGGTLESEFNETGLTMHKIEPRFPFDPVYIWNLRKVFKKEKINIIHAHQYLDALYAYIAVLGIDNIKVIQTYHGHNSPKSRLLNFIIKRTDKNIFVSKAQREYYLNNWDLDPKKQIVLYNGISFHKFDNALSEKKILPQIELELGMVGNFVSGRDQYTVCKFLKLLKDKGINFKFFFIGKKSDSEPLYYEKCVEFCKRNNLNENVHFLGSRSDIPQLLNKLDAFIYSTNHDTFGIAVIEAISMEIPVFVNDWEALTEITLNGDLATLYKTKNEKDLLDKFLNFLSNKEFYKQKAIKAAQKVRELYSIENHIKKLEELYSSLLNIRK